MVRWLLGVPIGNGQTNVPAGNGYTAIAARGHPQPGDPAPGAGAGELALLALGLPFLVWRNSRRGGTGSRVTSDSFSPRPPERSL